MEKYQVFGAYTKEESQREKNHKELARTVATEGIVLLKNDGVLPVKEKKIALYGPGSRMTVKGGRGSGDVRERHSVSIEEGMKNAGYVFPTTLWMDRFEKKYEQDVNQWKASVEAMIKGYSPLKTMEMFTKIGEHPMPYPQCTPIFSDELTDETETAIYVLARQAGEGNDRQLEKGDYFLSEVEEESLRMLSVHYKKLILVLNCGSSIDLSILDEIRVDALLFFAQGGMEGGNALADLISGKKNPSGKLTDTWAYHYEDYPFSDSYSFLNGNTDVEEYKEGLYVGYRYFSTFDVKPRFCFGYGLSYTKFSHDVCDVCAKGAVISIAVNVNNLGETYAGKESLQVYVRKPKGVREHEKYSLAAFAKSKELMPGETQRLVLSLDLKQMADFNEEEHVFELPAGEYGIYLGTSIEAISLCAVAVISELMVTKQVSSSLQYRTVFKDLQGETEEANYPEEVKRIYIPEDSKENVMNDTAVETFSEKIETIYKRLSSKEKGMIVTGGGYRTNCYNNVMGAAGRTNTKLLKKGIPNIVLADGPAGLNVIPEIVTMKDGSPRYPGDLPADWQWGWLHKVQFLVKAKPGKGRPSYRYMTAWPSETLQAQTWDEQLLEEVGAAVGREMLEIGVSVWLAPGLNLHRNPLCGRNFEYYSEDPLVSGKMAAAVTKGVQKNPGVGVTIKHFCCNNQEENRNRVSEQVSERVLRELYLKGFQIAVTEAEPWTVMSSYNQVNDTYVCNSRELCTQVLRKEWGFEGVVMSDWNAVDQCSYEGAINAGNDLIMPGTKEVAKQIQVAYEKGKITEEAMALSVKRVLRLIFQSATCNKF